jgi:hypothetical protein
MMPINATEKTLLGREEGRKTQRGERHERNALPPNCDPRSPSLAPCSELGSLTTISGVEEERN